MKQLISTILSDEPEPKRFIDSEIAFLTAEFEAFVIQARSLITVAQIHTLDACRVPFGGHLTNAKYEKVVKKAPEDVSHRLIRAQNYFAQNVFGHNKWGSLLKSLRDKVVHFDRIRPSITSSDEESEELTVVGLSLERLAQDFENGTYDLIVSVIAPIWDRDWKPGPYKPGMWE
jgi:hypothetical protein